MKGEVVSLHLFDVGGSFDLAELTRRFDARGPTSGPAIGKGTPAYVEFPRPLVVTAPGVDLETPVGRVAASVVLAFYPIGAVTVRFRAPIEADAAGLTKWNEARALVGAQRLPLDQAARELVERDRPMWEPGIVDRYTKSLLHEAYTVFAFSEVGEDTQTFVQVREREIAGLLKGEDGARLHDKEVREALKEWFSYYTDDVVVVDWDAALVVDPDRDYEDLLFVLEIANLQLLEFRAYDDYLDDLIGKSYDELAALFRRPSLFRNARRTVHELSLTRMEIAELADEADNITKFLGDWFLARVYEAAQHKFHIPEWRATVDDKLSTINKLYTLANEESDSNRLLTLELLIVLLFVLDVVIIWLR